ncbi:hypothetical protein ACWDOR_37890 [Streptosporangium canum]
MTVSHAAIPLDSSGVLPLGDLLGSGLVIGDPVAARDGLPAASFEKRPVHRQACERLVERSGRHSDTMMSTIEADDAWCPPALIPVSLGRLRLAASTIDVASHRTRREISRRVAMSYGWASLAVRPMGGRRPVWAGAASDAALVS